MSPLLNSGQNLWLLWPTRYGRNDAVPDGKRLAASSTGIFDLKNPGPQIADPVELPSNSQHHLVTYGSKTSENGPSAQLSHTSWHCVEQRQAFRADDCPNCKFMRKINNCYCFKPIIFRVVCYTAVDNQKNEREEKRSEIAMFFLHGTTQG